MEEVRHCRNCLNDLVKEKRVEITAAMKQHQEISNKVSRLLLLRERINLLRETCDSQKQILHNISEDLKTCTDSNSRKENKLKRAQSRDFDKKLLHAQTDFTRKEHALSKNKQELTLLRKNFITQLMKRVFPISLSAINTTEQQTKGTSNELIDYELIEGDWLSTVRHNTPQNSLFDKIGYCYLPHDGNLTEYIRNFKLKKAISTISNDEDSGGCEIDLNDLTQSIPVSVSLLSHLIWIIANVLDQSLPYSLLLPVVLCEYGKPDRKAQTIVRFLAKLDDNIMFLCFTQNVSPQSLTIGHTLKNISVLVNHHELGRSGPFTCYPELLHYQIVCKKRKTSLAEDHMISWEDEPPLLHSAQDEDANKSQQDNESSTDNDEDDSDLDIDNNNDTTVVSEGWEEVQDLMIPTHLLSGFYGDRLEYGTSYSEYGHRAVVSEAEQQDMYSNGSIQSSTGLLDTLSSLLGSSGWTKK